MTYEVEEWKSYEYPSYWDYEESFSDYQDAVDYIRSQDSGSYRIIQELYRND